MREVEVSLPEATVSLKPHLRLSDASVQAILAKAPSAQVTERTETRMKANIETTDWFTLGVWLLTANLSDVAFVMTDIDDNPYVVTVVFFNPYNVGVSHVAKAKNALANDFGTLRHHI